jgi:hypothetical protein
VACGEGISILDRWRGWWTFWLWQRWFL